MKTIRKSLALVACLATAVVSCNKEISSPVSSEEGILLTFTSEMPNRENDTDSRTAYNSSTNTIDWSSQDQIRIGITVDNVWMAREGAPAAGKYPKLYASAPLSTAGHIAQFEVKQFSLTESGTYRFFGLYPSTTMADTDFENPPYVSINIPSVQTPPAGNYFQNADIMYATSGAYDGLPQDKLIDLNWTRVVAHGDITLKNLPTFSSGETLSSVTLTAQSTADLTGVHTLDITNGNIALPTGETTTPYVKVNLGNQTINSENNTLEFWFVSLPFTATELTVVLETNLKTYTKTYSNISKSFLANKRNTLGISMSNATSTDKPQPTQVIQDGTYIIAYIDNDNRVMMLSEVYNTSFLAYSNLPTNLNSVSSNAIWDISFVGDGKYTIQSVDNNQYLSASGSSTSLSMTNSGTEFDGDYFDDSKTTYKLTLPSDNNGYRGIGFNKTSNPPRFGFYSSTATDQSIKLTLIPVTSLRFAEPIVSLTDSNYDSFNGQTVIVTPEDPIVSSNITYSLSGDNIGSINTSSGVVSLDGSLGTATITASFPGDASHRQATASYKITVVDSSICYYEKVTSNDNLTDGQYLIVYEASSVAFNGGLETLDAVSNTISVTIINEKIESTQTTDAASFTISISDGTILSASGKYIGRTSDDNGLQTSTTSSFNNSITIDAQKNAVITAIFNGSNGKTRLKYNSASNQSRFRYFKDDGQSPIALYKLSDGKESAEIGYSPNNQTITFGENLSQPTLSNPHSLTGITYQSNKETVATVSASGVIEVVGAGSATITASWEDETINGVIYRAGSVTYNLTVNKATPTIAAFVNPTTTVAVGGTVTNTTTINPNTLSITYVSSDETVATVTNTGIVTGINNGQATISATFAGNENYNAAEPVSYTIKVGNGSSAQKTSTLTFTSACNGSGTADDGAIWTVTSDANESNFDSTKGIHYGTGKQAVSYLILSSSSISGTITGIKVNASGASGTSAKLNVTVGGSAFGSQQSLTSSATNYSFSGSASGAIVISITQSSATKALYCKSIEVTYTN